MKFLMIIAHDDNFAPTNRLITSIMSWINKATKAGVRITGNPLRPASEAMTVRIRKTKTQITSGPFENSHECMCAYELIECKDMKTAIKVAASHPMAKAATIEIRPIWDGLG